jgi:putative ABC transport system ATP-binding protein
VSAHAALALKDVSWFYGRGNLRKQVLYDVDAVIQPGEITILTGPSGAGKTTLLQLIGALRRPQAGSIRVLGRELADAGEGELLAVRRRIGFLFRRHNLVESLTVAGNVRMAMALCQETPRKAWETRLNEVLEQVGLAGLQRKRPTQLSAGQRQRVGIARALVNHPKLILADDPTANLDQESGHQLATLLQRLAKEECAAAVIVSSDHRILDIADRILHLEDGRVRPLADAVAHDTSRMLNILARHEPGAPAYLATLALALTRVASADAVITDEESTAIRDILHRQSDMTSGEVELVMALSRSLLGVAGQQDLAARKEQLLRALKAVAASDGRTSDEEQLEIGRIMQDLGLG